MISNADVNATSTINKCKCGAVPHLALHTMIHPEVYTVECDKCHRTTAPFNVISEAIKNWNEGNSFEQGYEKILNEVIETIPYWDDVLVVIKMKYKHETDYTYICELVLYDDDKHELVWQSDWWEGQEEVNLVAYYPITEISQAIVQFTKARH